MKKVTKIYFLSVLMLVLLSCGSNYKYWDISEFKMDNHALEDNEEIKLIYTSRGPDFNEDKDYYIHVVVVSQRTGDTINVLTTGDNGFKEGDGDKIFVFLNENNVMTRFMNLNAEERAATKNINELANKEEKRLEKVARDPNFDFIADNDFPTIIGSIGFDVDDLDIQVPNQ